MPVRSAALGAELDPSTVAVTPRMTLAYAAGIGDVGPRTFDDAGPRPLVAPPAFCVRLEWTVLLASRGATLGLDEKERLQAVHVEQDSTFHAPIRPGDALTTRARVVAIRATRAGALVQTRLSTAHARTGAPVVTSWHSVIYRGVAVAGPDGRLEEAPFVPEAPSALPRRATLLVPREAAHVYTECSGIWNPIHTERRVALAAGLPDVILHGTAAWAIAGREVIGSHAEGDPTRLLRLRARFKAPIVPGGALELDHGPGAGEGQAHFRMTTPQGAIALDGGFARIAV
jgi:acyl dehydratase